MFKVFIEGYEMPCASVRVETGLGPLSAQIVIPPGDSRRKILPGSRVLVFIKDDGYYYEWFQGTITNRPEIALGFDEYPVTLNVIGDIGLLQSILMNYLSLGQVDVRNQNFKSRSLAGKVNLFRAGLGPLLFPFTQALTDRNIGFGDRLIGIIQALVSMDPQGWEDLRRMQYLDRLAVDMADDVASELDMRIVGISVANALSSLQVESFTALDVLNIILQMSLHELVSVAPLRYARNTEMPVVDRHANYMPRGLSIEELASISQGDLVAKFCKRVNVKKTIIDHFIKPVDMFSTPAVNEITKGMYNTAYVTDNKKTRSIIKVPLHITAQPIATFEELMPPALDSVFKAVTSASVQAANAPSLGAVSSVMAERITGFRTNEEKVYGGVNASYRGFDPRVNSMMMSLAMKEKEDNKKNQEYQRTYSRAMMRFEYERDNGANVTIQNATFNMAPIPGYAIRVQDSNGGWYCGKLVKKVDLIDLGSQVASTTYMISQCKSEDAYNYNGTVSTDLSADTSEWFGKYGKDAQTSVSPLFAGYNAERLKTALAPLPDVGDKYVNYERSLSMNHLRELSERELGPETRYDRSASGLSLVVGTGKPSIQTRMDTLLSEAFYSNFDLIGEIAVQALGHDLTELSPYLPYLNISKREAIALLDTKEGNIFSVFLKTIGDEVIAKSAAIATTSAIMDTSLQDWQIAQDAGDEIASESRAAEVAKSENQRIDGVNSEIKKMFGAYNPNFPIYLGNPSPLRMELLLWLMTMTSDSGIKRLLEDGDSSYSNKDNAIPRPLSDRNVIKMRREIAKKASNE
jgi:hypothetical protein